jgi:hypothetical protein
MFGFPDPAEQNESDPLYMTLYKKAMGLISGTDPQDQAINAAFPGSVAMAPIRKAITRRGAGSGRAIDALLELLNGFKPEERTILPEGRPRGAYVPPPTTVKVPEGLEGVVRLPEMDPAIGRAPRLTTIRRQQGKTRELTAREARAGEGLKAIPRVSSPDEIELAAKTSVGVPSEGRKLTAQEMRTKQAIANGGIVQKVPGNAKLNPDIVRQIRAMTGKSLTEVAAAFPDINPETLRSVLVGDSWSQIK